jgi:aspartokinase-like uncharacterized kinase
VSLACVVKLGGSYARSPLLRAWLRAIAAAAGEVAIVPGGGPFADAVRAAQRQIGFDDRAAHLMALHAMAQFGIALESIGADFGLARAAGFGAIGLVLAGRKVPVWSPLAMLRDAPEVPESWSVTSDSLALWLATQLNAHSLLLVKPRAAPPGASVADLVADQFLDAAFPGFLARYSGAVFLAGPEDLPKKLDARNPPGMPLRALA